MATKSFYGSGDSRYVIIIVPEGKQVGSLGNKGSSGKIPVWLEKDLAFLGAALEALESGLCSSTKKYVA